MHAELNCEGVRVARRPVERLMRADGLRRIPRERIRKTTIGDGAETERPEDLVRRKLVATAPNQLWVADFKSRRPRPTGATSPDPGSCLATAAAAAVTDG
jgi:putative transposase